MTARCIINQDLLSRLSERDGFPLPLSTPSPITKINIYNFTRSGQIRCNTGIINTIKTSQRQVFAVSPDWIKGPVFSLSLSPFLFFLPLSLLIPTFSFQSYNKPRCKRGYTGPTSQYHRLVLSNDINKKECCMKCLQGAGRMGSCHPPQEGTGTLGRKTQPIESIYLQDESV